MSDVLVVGCGLLGTSVGLALQGSDLGDVTLWDSAPAAVQVAVGKGAGRSWDGVERAELAVVAVPPASTSDVLLWLQRLDIARTYTHVCSIQSQVEAEVESESPDPSWIVGGHPLAGREVSGARAALADLFVGRTWAVCPPEGAAPEAVAAVHRLARACGAVPLEVASEAHDSAVALLSHLPQVASSALASLLVPEADAAPEQMALSGPGLADTTRLAGGAAGLWGEVLEANAGHVAPRVRALADELARIASVLEGLAQPPASEPGDVQARLALRVELEGFLLRGNTGRDLVPVKRGELAGAFSGVRVDLPDEPGQLARLLNAAGEAGVNVEDLRVEHVPGRPRGVVELLVAPAAAPPLADALSAAGWQLVL